MADAEKHMTLHIVAGTAELGVWCDRCLLPSGFRVPMCSLTEHGVTVVKVAGFCRQCGAWMGSASSKGE